MEKFTMSFDVEARPIENQELHDGLLAVSFKDEHIDLSSAKCPSDYVITKLLGYYKRRVVNPLLGTVTVSLGFKQFCIAKVELREIQTDSEKWMTCRELFASSFETISSDSIWFMCDALNKYFNLREVEESYEHNFLHDELCIHLEGDEREFSDLMLPVVSKDLENLLFTNYRI